MRCNRVTEMVTNDAASILAKLDSLLAANRVAQSLIAQGSATRIKWPNQETAIDTSRKSATGTATESNPLETKLAQMSEANEEIRLGDIRRIVNLPIERWMDAPEFELFCRRNILAHAFEGVNQKPFRFFEPQANAIRAFHTYGKLFAPIGVGWGKTLICLAIAHHAFNNGTKKIALFVPPQVYNQLTERDIQWARKRIPFNVPVIGLYDGSKFQRRAKALSGNYGLYIVPYSTMSTKQGLEMLWGIAPRLMMFDECHLLRHRNTARTRRIEDYLKKNKPAVVALSGTITNKGLMDYHHLIKYCLEDGMPLPMAVNTAQAWALVIDSGALPSDSMMGPVEPLVQWHRRNFSPKPAPDNITMIRGAFRTRLTTAPGVIATSDQDIGVSLLIANQPADTEGQEGFLEVERLMKMVDKEWLTPDGDEIPHAMLKYKWFYELTAGFYNRLVWPDAASYARRKNLKESVAEEEIEAAKTHHEALNLYHKKLRHFIAHKSYPGLDTPMVIGADMHQHGPKNVGNELFKAWKDAHDMEWDGMPTRMKSTVRVSPYKIKHAIRWAEQVRNDGGIIWVFNREIGKWAHELVIAAGFDCLFAPAGMNDEIADERNAKRIVIASEGGHSIGKNLQHFSEQVCLQWPRSPALAEQMLGRTHRNGQQADELVVWTMNTTEFDHHLFASTLMDSVYIHQTTDVRQKVVYANYYPMPKIYPPEFLNERSGLDVKILTQEMRAALAERFQQEERVA